MSELEDIRARAAERRGRCWVINNPVRRRPHERKGFDCDEAEADLDRALQTAEKLQLTVDESADIVASSLGFKRITDELRKQRDQARADVLALRQLATLDEVGNSWVRKLMDDTALYEKYRHGGPDGAAEG